MVSNDNDITDLLIPEDDLLSFHVPEYNAVRAAYSKSFKNKSNNNSDLIERINQVFPKKNKSVKTKKDDDSPGFSIPPDDDPLLI